MITKELVDVRVQMHDYKTLEVNGVKIIIMHDIDILKVKSDVIVNPVNNYLELYQGGIAGQVSKMGGDTI